MVMEMNEEKPPAEKIYNRLVASPNLRLFETVEEVRTFIDKQLKRERQKERQRILDLIDNTKKGISDKDRAGRNFNRGWNQALEDLKSKIEGES